MEKIKLKYAETMVSYGCNLSCVGCTNYAEYPHGGFPDWEKFKQEMLQWSSVVHIAKFGLIGGEPLLNPQLKDWIYGMREILPETGILLVTNGVFLNKKPEVVKWLIDIGYSKMMVTLHRDQDREQILNNVAQVMADSGYRFMKKDNSVGKLMDCEYVMIAKETTFSIHILETDHFLKRYKGYGNRIYPFDTPDIEEAYSRCVDRPIMYEGRLYKCSKMALLKRQLSLTGQIDSPEDREPWEPYLAYKGLQHSDEPSKIKSFLHALYLPEDICRSCPSKCDEESNVDHKSNTFNKQDWMKKYGESLTIVR